MCSRPRIGPCSVALPITVRFLAQYMYTFPSFGKRIVCFAHLSGRSNVKSKYSTNNFQKN